MVQITLSSNSYEVLISLLHDEMCRTSRAFSVAPLNSPEEAASSVHLSILFDVQAEMVVTAEYLG